MKFKAVPLGESYRLMGPGPLVLVSSGDAKRADVAPIAWTTPVSDEPPMAAVVVYKKHFTAELIRKTKSFVVNVPDVSLLKAVRLFSAHR